MVLIAILGSMGEGKTLGATYLAYRKYAKDGLNIFANYHIKFPPLPEEKKTPNISFLRGIDDVMNMRDGYAVLDELWTSMDSRQSNSKKNKFITNVLLKLRKRGVNVAYTCQSFHQVDKRVRDVTDFIAKPHLNRDETICRLEIFSMPDMNLVKIRKFPTTPFFKFYDTNEEVGSLFGDDDESKLREINKENDAKKKEFIDDGDDDIPEEVDDTIEESEANQLPSVDETVPKKSADEEFD
jgi:Zonular occludens toxin (Zot)